MTTALWILGLTLAFEGLTCWLRFGRGLTSRNDTRFMARLTGGIRIHHGYVGLVMMAVVAAIPGVAGAEWAWRIGWALFLSDAVHHFLVLWPITGSPEFDLTYPREVVEPVSVPVPVPVPVSQQADPRE